MARILRDIHAEAPLSTESEVDVLTMQVIKVLRAENADAFCEAEAADFNWDKFFEFVMQLVEVLLPLIIK